MERISTDRLPAVLTTNTFLRLTDSHHFILFPEKPILIATKWLTLVPAKLETEFVKVYEVVSDGVQQAWVFQPLTKRVKAGSSHLLMHSSALDDRETRMSYAAGSGLQVRYALPDWHYLSDPSNLVLITLPPSQTFIETLES